jgi:hypothetical protein
MTVRERIVEQFNERAAIMQYEGEMTAVEAERSAIEDMAVIHGQWVRGFLSKVVSDVRRASA